MSLTSALNASVAGLQSQSRQLAAISENIANTSTTAYKNREVHFEAIVTNNNTGVSGFSTGSLGAKNPAASPDCRRQRR